MERITEIIPEETKKLLKERSNIFYDTKLGFLKEHNGLRDGKLHLVLGTASSGKSTLVRSLLKDVIENSMECGKVLVYLSEESTQDFKIDFFRACNDLKLNEIVVKSELRIENNFLNEMINLIKKEKPNIFIFDNITTSLMYADKRPHEQYELVKALKAECEQLKIPFVLIAHTNAETTENSNRLINMNDVRGSKSIVNLVEFLYILQRFKIRENYYPTIRIVKHRGYNVTNNLYYLVFNPEKFCYTETRNICFEEFKEAYYLRDKLTK